MALKKYIKILLYVLVGFLCILLFLLYKENKDYTGYVLKLERILNQTLQENGIKNEKIISQYADKKKQGLYTWIELNKEITLPDQKAVNSFIKTLSANLQPLKPKISSDGRKDGSILLTIGNKKLKFVNIIIRIPPRIKLAIVIDDCGYEMKHFQQFLELNIPLTFAIMPKEKYSKDICQLLESRKMPHILHLPMQPEGYPKIDPGKQALLVKMNKEEIRRKVLDNMDSVGSPAGVNNHMGSEFTKNRAGMRTFFEVLKGKNLFFLDSLTTDKSVGRRIAKEFSVKYLANDVFLDVVDTEEGVNKEFMRLLNVSKKKGYAIAIGHVQKKNLCAVMEEIVPQIRDSGFEFVYLTDLP